MTRPYRHLSSTSNSSFDQTAAQPPEAVAVESDFVVILAALLCALICVLGLIAVARCAWLRRSSTPTTSRRSSGQRTPNKGMKKKAVESLPKFVYTSNNNNINNNNNNKQGDEKNDKNDDNEQKCWNIISSGECAICLSEYVNGDEIRVLPQCGHNFHVACIDMWLNSHSSCPSCRQMLVMTRCRKCGEFPVVSSGEGSSETVRKGRQHDNTSCSSDYLP